MTQKQKELLLKDLCARFPYNCRVFYEYIDDLDGKTYGYSLTLNTWCIDEFVANKAVIKPYLFPMSSMTSEQLHEIQSILGDDCKIENDFIRIVNSERNTLSYQEIKAVFNYCYKNHLDINGLIPRGLGIDATGLNVY